MVWKAPFVVKLIEIGNEFTDLSSNYGCGCFYYICANEFRKGKDPISLLLAMD